MSSTVSIAQYAQRAEAAEAKIAELTALAAKIQAAAGGSSSNTGSGEAGIGEFKDYFLGKLTTLRSVVAEEHEEFLRLQKENSKLRYRVEILTRELSAQLGTPVPESIFKDSEAEAAGAKNDKKGKEKDKGKERSEKESDKKDAKDKGEDKSKDKEKDKGKPKDKSEQKPSEKAERKPSEKVERKPSEKSERKPSERKRSEKEASETSTVTVHAGEGADKGKKAVKGKEHSQKEGSAATESNEQNKKDGKKGGKKDEASGESKKDGKKEGDASKGGEKSKKDSTRTESEKGEGAQKEGAKKGNQKKGDAAKSDDAAKSGDAAKSVAAKSGDAKKSGDKPKEEAKLGELDDKAVKACLKEGGKKAQDCVGMSTFGTHFFCVTIESADGNMKLLEKVMEGMNAEVDPEAEDRKGGAGDLGKIIFNANDQKLVIMCHTPKEVMEKATAAEWMAGVLTATGAKITSQNENFIQAELDNDPDHGVYSLKLRDQGISASFEFLRSKGLMIEDDSDDENYAAAAGINLNAAPGADY